MHVTEPEKDTSAYSGAYKNNLAHSIEEARRGCCVRVCLLLWVNYGREIWCCKPFPHNAVLMLMKMLLAVTVITSPSRVLVDCFNLPIPVRTSLESDVSTVIDPRQVFESALLWNECVLVVPLHLIDELLRWGLPSLAFGLKGRDDLWDRISEWVSTSWGLEPLQYCQPIWWHMSTWSDFELALLVSLDFPKIFLFPSIP